MSEQLTRKKDKDFAERMMGVFNSAALAMMTSIGHRTKLFDVMSELPPSTSPHIALKAGLNERYVREWLGAMVTGRVITYDPEEKEYYLPPEHADWLTRAASPSNVAVTAQWIAVLGSVEDKIVDCFHKGGGLPYELFNRFHEVMADESAQTVVASLQDKILPLAPGLIERLEKGIDVLDVGCGSGRAMIALAWQYPSSHFSGYDFSEEAIKRGCAEAGQMGIKNIRLEVRDAARIDETANYDLITAFDAIHDQGDPVGVLQQIKKALRPGGLFFMQDIDTSSHLEKNMDHPIGTFLFTISCMHCMSVSLAQGGAGLGACWGEELACQMLEEAGFANVDVQRLPHDFLNCYYIATS